LNLEKWDFSEKGAFHLGGEWEFYWEKLYTPEDFQLNNVQKKDFILFPGTWNGKIVNGKILDGKGYATFRFRINVNSKHLDSPFHLKIPDIPTAYKLWVNGKLLMQQGIVGKTEETMKPKFLRSIVSFSTQQKQIEIVLQTSNFFHKDGGTWRALSIGKDQNLAHLKIFPRFLDSMLFGSLFVMGIYNVSFFLFRRKEKAALFFGLFCLLIGARSLIIGERYLLQAYPNYNWFYQQMIEYLLLYCSYPAFCAFFYEFYKGQPEFSKKIIQIPMVITFVLCMSILFFPAKTYSFNSLFFQGAAAITAIYFLYLVIRVVWRSPNLVNILLGIGFLFLFTTVINDILYTLLIVHTRDLIHVGAFFFLIFKSFSILHRFTKTLRQVEVYSNELAVKNSQLLQLNQVKDEFLVNTSHELKTPIYGMVGLAQSMLSEKKENLSEHQRQNLWMISSSGRRLSSLINDILDFSKMKKGDLQLTIQNVDLRSMIDLVLRFIEPLVNGKKVDLIRDVSTNLPLVLADNERLQQVLFNLLGNAVKYTSEGKITIRVREIDNVVKVEIIDTGIGIISEHQQQIFQAFRQKDYLSDQTLGGTGLGLSISQRLMELHGSHIHVLSEIGKGSNFSFELKTSKTSDIEVIEKENEQETAIRLLQELQKTKSNTSEYEERIQNHEFKENKSVDNHSFYKKKILIVDDEIVNIKVLSNLLKSAGYYVLEATSGEEALKIVAIEEPDLIMLDLMMPRMNGYEVCQKVRENYDLLSLPIVLLTANHHVKSIIQGFACGANDYLSKPFRKEELLARIETQLRAKQLLEKINENSQLRQEIEKRKQVEKDLRGAQHRLVRILDCSEDAIIVLDEYQIITFFNQGAENVLSFSVNEALNQHLDLIFSEDFLETYHHLIRDKKEYSSYQIQLKEESSILRKQNQKIEDIQVFLSSFRIQDSLHYALFISKQNASMSNSFPLQHSFTSMLEGVEWTRNKILALENGLIEVANLYDKGIRINDTIKRVDKDELVKDQQVSSLLDQKQDVRELGVKTMSLALTIWEKSTGKTKIEFAEESEIWKVYLDQGTFKTRTLDKYLNLKSLPKKPRWREVVRSAHYILDRCTPQELEKTTLTSSVAELENFLQN
ncbi:MAG: two-component system sensor histidine kinase ChiS, partial [bacterium]